MNPLQIIYAVIGLALVSAGGAYIWRCEDAKQFQALAIVQAKAAQKAADEQAAKDRKAKEKADDENQTTIARLRADVKRLSGKHPSGGGVPPAAPGSRRPDLACFERAQLGEALRGYRDGVLALVGEGAEAAVNLDTARRWAQKE